jgi:hypothetical protein
MRYHNDFDVLSIAKIGNLMLEIAKEIEEEEKEEEKSPKILYTVRPYCVNHPEKYSEFVCLDYNQSPICCECILLHDRTHRILTFKGIKARNETLEKSLSDLSLTLQKRKD